MVSEGELSEVHCKSCKMSAWWDRDLKECVVDCPANTTVRLHEECIPWDPMMEEKMDACTARNAVYNETLEECQCEEGFMWSNRMDEMMKELMAMPDPMMGDRRRVLE